jgi:putative transposase
VALAVRSWLDRADVQTLFIAKGSPWENGYVESFNGKLRQVCLTQYWFLSLEDVQEVIEVWREDYKQHRPLCAVGGRSPVEFAIFSRGASPP